MAPALTAESLSPKEKLTSGASPATGTRQSIRKLELPIAGDQVKKSTAAAAATKRVTRSKDSAQRTGSPLVQTPANSINKRKSNNNNNNNNNISSSGAANTSDDQMGLSAAATHTSTDGCTASSSSGSGSAASAATAPTDAAATATEHNNNFKDNSTAELLANLTNDFAETFQTAEICLRKTLPEVSLSKEQPAPTTTEAVISANTAQLHQLGSMPEDQSQSQSQSTSIATAKQLSQEQLPPIADITDAEAAAVTAELDAASEIPDCLEERLSQLDGSSSATTTLEARVALQDTASRQEQQQNQPHPEILASPQHAAVRQPGTLLTPQSTASSIGFLKDGASGAVLEDQDIEEVLKVLKTFDGSQVNPDTICDFNFFNEECFLNNEEDAAAAVAATATATPGVNSSLELPALVEVEESLPKASCSSSSITCNTRPWQESHAELEKKQQVLVRKMDVMVRRMRKFQARQMCRHASDEVGGILEWSARCSQNATPGAPVRSAKLTEQQDTVLSIVSGRPGISFWEEQIKNPLPASQMCNVLRHIDSAARKQQVCHTVGGGSASLAPSSSWYSSAMQPGKRARKPQAMDATSSGAADTINTPRTDEIVPNFDNYVTSELTHVAGLLHTEMREVQNAIDSDATESSSGGESADEMVNYNNSQQLSLSITKRAVWRYSQDRAALALRWNWLCAQMVDLDMKIRQHQDVYNDLCRNKGDVLLEPTPAPKNGYKEQAQSELELEPEQMSGDWLCSRARPLVLTEFRKRKLFQTTNMHTISKKAARPSNIKCGCQWPQVPCTLCTGRPDPTAPRELPETLMPQNRAALLDPGYHPVLSFTADVCQSVHLEAIGRQPDWQYRVMRSQAKSIVKAVWKAEREALATSGGGPGRRPGETTKRRYVRRKERNNNNNNNNNRTNSSNKETANSIAGSSVVGVDCGNGTGTATTSSSSTPTTTPLVANTAAAAGGPAAKRQRQLAPTSGTSLPLSETRRQQSNPSLISGDNGAKKSRKSASAQHQQNSVHSIQNNHTRTNNSNTNNNSNNSQQPSGGDSSSSNRIPGDSHSQWEQQRSRCNSSETHGHRNERSSERRSRLIYDIDNIVIPYSMAAQTRVEILPYKEIPTPKWRIVDTDNKEIKKEPKLKSTEKISNGCAEKVDKESKSELSNSTTKSTGALATTAKEITAATETITETKTTTTATETTTTATKTTTTATKTTTTATETTPTTTETITTPTIKLASKLNNNNNCSDTPKEIIAKPASKVNGIKHLNKKQLEPLRQQAASQALSNGLVNGNTQQALQPDQHFKQSAAPTDRPLNGKTKKLNNKIPVNNGSNGSIAAKKVTKSVVAAPHETLEPPKKRPKLQVDSTKRELMAKPATRTAAAAVPAEEDEVEDISDEAYILRHQRALVEERQRFETFLKFPWSTRSRANRRADSRAESSGANTPDPASPAASHLAGPVADNESIPSPLAQTGLQHPLDAGNADNSTADLACPAVKRQERRRTTSSKFKEQHERRSATPDTRDYLQEPPPFEPLLFPLSDETFQRLLAEMYAEPKEVATPTPAVTKRTKSKSISSNGGDGSSTSTAGNRRSSKAKTSNASKLAHAAKTTATTITQLNGGKNAQQQQQLQQATSQTNGGKENGDGYDDGVDYEPEEDEDVELLLEEDDDFHYLAPQDDDPLPSGTGDKNLYNASINAYLGEQDGLDDEDLTDDPFMDDDPNDPEWKRSIGVRSERVRRRI